MIRKFHVPALVILFLALIPASAFSAPGRWERSLSGPEWRLWLDKQAEWRDDELFLPPADLSRIPVNPPSGGWERFEYAPLAIKVNVPGTVEEHYWGANGNPVGIAGDVRGVSWWSTTFRLPNELRGKRIVLDFECANLRAEVFVNRKLVGYDVVGNTPFRVDATGAAVFGGENRLDIRITDPVGNFSWPAHVTFPWGRYRVPAVRGFGGITGDITLRALDPVAIDDIYVQNRPEITEARVFVTVENTSGRPVEGALTLAVHEEGNPERVLWQGTAKESIPSGGKVVEFTVKAPKARLWDIYQPNLYTAAALFRSSDGSMQDSAGQRFGFRWFDMAMKNGDMRLYLNTRRVFIKGCKNRTFWPTNGMYASPEWAKKDIALIKQLGYNGLNVTNAIPQPNHVKACEEAGLLYTGGVSGYRINGPDGKPIPDTFTRQWRLEKLRRFILRGRSSPSLYFRQLKSEDPNHPDEDDYRALEMMMEMDPTRITIYNGDRDRMIRDPRVNDPKTPAKTMYRPLDMTRYTHGWWDQHHWGHAGYRDDYYYNPRNYLRMNIVDFDSTAKIVPDEVIYYSEEGSFGTIFSLGKMKEQIDSRGSANGWREREHLDWYKAYDRFLDESGFRSSFPTVDHLTRRLGENLFYFHGRALENCRISNMVDAYVINGSASGGTHTDIFDVYRNPSSEPEILSYYMQPLYVAVKLRNKVMPVGFAPLADVFIVNERNVQGKHDLELELQGPEGTVLWRKTLPVNILGGEEYGQLLAEAVQLPPVPAQGSYDLKAFISMKGRRVCEGHDDIFAADLRSGPKLPSRAAVIDSSGAVNALLTATGRGALSGFDPAQRIYDLIVVGAHDFRSLRRSSYEPIMEQVLNGATLVVITNADQWAQAFTEPSGYQSVQYAGSERWGEASRLFVGKHRLLDGLPQAQAMGWEYQVFYEGDRAGLRLGYFGNETVVAMGAQDRKDIMTAVAVVPCGEGHIVLSTLDMLKHLNSTRPQAATAKKLFMNFIEPLR
ncbi:MAG: sugar-binding domain-containing protein [Candidatus Latescibacterota bacterium]